MGVPRNLACVLSTLLASCATPPVHEQPAPAESEYVPLIIAAIDAFLVEDCAMTRRYAQQALQIRPGDNLASELLSDSERADYMAYSGLVLLKHRYRAARDSLELATPEVVAAKRPVEQRIPSWASALDPRARFHPTLGLPLAVVHEATGIPMVLVVAGTFHMGGPADSPADDGALRPPVEVQLSPFYVARYETTQAQWQHVMGDIPASLRRRAARSSRGLQHQAPLGAWLPCTGFSWGALRTFLGKADARLPTEAEWECACYGSARRSSYTSSEPHLLVLMDVRRTGQNDLGIHGMLDNAAELCADKWPRDPVLSRDDPDARVLRGYYKPWWRCPYEPTYGAIHVGFRIAMDP